MAERPVEQSRGSRAGLGLITAAIGLYFSAVGLGLMPPPGGAGAPGWVVVACGLVFLLAGLAVTVQAIGRANDRGELPAEAPLWTKILQQAAVLVIVGCFAATGTWVSLFGAAEKFSGPVALARMTFGIGALVLWLVFIAVAWRTWRRVVEAARHG